MPALRNPEIPHSDVPHVYYQSGSGMWHLQMTVHGRGHHEGMFGTMKEAESAQPEFVRQYRCDCGSCVDRRATVPATIGQ
jgi:hypothetical protein